MPDRPRTARWRARLAAVAGGARGPERVDGTVGARAGPLPAQVGRLAALNGCRIGRELRDGGRGWRWWRRGRWRLYNRRRRWRRRRNLLLAAHRKHHQNNGGPHNNDFP